MVEEAEHSHRVKEAHFELSLQAAILNSPGMAELDLSGNGRLKSGELYNLLSTDDVIVLDLRGEKAFARTHIRGAYRCWLGQSGQLDAAAAAGSGVPEWRLQLCSGQAVVLYADEAEGALTEHPVHVALARHASPRELRVLDPGEFALFEESCVRWARGARGEGERAPAAREKEDARPPAA
jgi:hypothetical protein